MRRVLLAFVLLSAACGRPDAKGTAPAGGSSRAASPAAGRGSFVVSDDELVAFTRWQRDYMDQFRRHWDELHAVGDQYPDLLLRDTKAFEAKVAEVVAQQMPAKKALQDRFPLKDEKVELVTEAVGGIFHFKDAAQNFALVIARDEVRLDAARRRFGQKAIDDIVAREALILAALQGP